MDMHCTREIIGLIKMAIKEIERQLNKNLILRSRPYPENYRKLKDTKILHIDDVNKCRNVFDLVMICVDYNVVVSCNLSDFHKQLLRLFGVDGCRTLLEKGKCDGFSVSSRDFNFFAVRKGNKYGSIYCIDEEVEIKSLQNRYKKTLDSCRSVNWQLDRLMPPAQLASDLLNKKTYWKALPNLNEINYEHLYRAWQCLKPPMLEAICLGNPGKVYDYDINWAFPWAMKHTPSYSPQLFNFIDSKEYHKEAVEGFLYCNVYLDVDSRISPLTIRAGYSDLYHCYNPIGGIQGYWTKREIDLVLEKCLGSVEILAGTWIVPKFSEVSYPYSEAIYTLEQLKNRNDMYDFAKSIAPIVWGKLASSYGSPYFNPMAAATISSIVRERMIRLAIDNADSIIAIAADGLVSTKELDMNISNIIGDMKVKNYEDFLSLSDLYRYHSCSDVDWKIEEDGLVLPMKYTGLNYVLKFGGEIGRELGEQKIRYGSFKRSSPKLKLSTLRQELIQLTPPDEEEVVGLLNSKDQMNWEELYI